MATAKAAERTSAPQTSGMGPATGTRPWWQRGIALATGSASLLGLMLNQRYGYSAGLYDHVVLSPLGMQRADPTLFANDWTVANVPQPHWLFDLVTWAGMTIGNPALVYLLYFAASLLSFGAATTLLARAWVPARPWSAVLCVTALAATVPLYLLGSGGIFWPVALPNVLAGFLLYLTAAALLTGRHKVAATAAVAVAAVHVQQGAIAATLLLGVGAALVLTRRKVDVALLVGAIAAAGVTLFGLSLRSVAGDITDFAKLCDELIPYHCNASAWRTDEILSGIAMIALALLVVVYVAATERHRWFVVMLLPAAGLLTGLIVDILNVATLGVLAQGLNVYRISVLFLPFVAWGIVVPLFARLDERRRWIMAAVVGCVWYVSLRRPTWGLISQGDARNGHWLLLLGIAVVVACLAMTSNTVVKDSVMTNRAVVALVIFACMSSAVGGRAVDLRGFDPGFFTKRPDLAGWGARVERAVPSGDQLLLPPDLVDARMATKRAVVVDCKYGPYGGPAYHEYMRRMNDLGGIEQCTGGSASGYDALSTRQLTRLADKYGANFIGLTETQFFPAIQLRRDGWELVVRRQGEGTADIWRSPDHGANAASD